MMIVTLGAEANQEQKKQRKNFKKYVWFFLKKNISKYVPTSVHMYKHGMKLFDKLSS